VITPSGNLPRANVRVGQAVLRNMRVPVGARWVHVDLEQQILTAYEGERLVFATLVSTGRRDGSTRTGVFEVRRKITYTQMRGGGASPYSVEGVPYVLYFDGAVALHGAFWHDGFGQRRSHGCVNLAPADAQFLFDFAPPELPAGWRSVNPIALGLDSLWVEVS
jgi:lipoprotein-anchoring transpeptidase ErfK/SrfK